MLNVLVLKPDKREMSNTEKYMHYKYVTLATLNVI